MVVVDVCVVVLYCSTKEEVWEVAEVEERL